MKNTIIEFCKFILKAFCLFPIKRNRILFSAYSGKSYSCNPKYITEKLLEKDNGSLEIVWAFADINGHSGLDSRIKTVRFKSFRYLYYAMTAAVFIDNVESWSILPRRKGQYVINTWHGGGAYKGVGLMRRDTDPGIDRNMLSKNERIDLYLSSSRAFTEMTLRSSFGYKGEVLECGMPRNDILLNYDADKARQIRERLSVEPDRKLVLYAPTFRADRSSVCVPDVPALISALKERFGGEWTVLYRAHYYTDPDTAGNGGMIDVSGWEDMQELLLISDVLITDYSSSIWDFSLLEKPGFLYVPDLSDYAGEREFYTPIGTWPYPYAQTMEELCGLIRSYDEDASLSRIRAHHKELQSTESGKASETAAQIAAAHAGMNAKEYSK
ncbi:MAG: CDP-glycerol glycerophosphotransferase family protein [Firmicutes bacterium]|nr:CDP-glycerol glycerophosphotransferase family protein [Bacillota bacterium]MBQ3931290.1 CDP-glycerol glycerophosphotransferase family protein [Bacillota bacterium]